MPEAKQPNGAALSLFLVTPPCLAQMVGPQRPASLFQHALFVVYASDGSSDGSPAFARRRELLGRAGAVTSNARDIFVHLSTIHVYLRGLSSCRDPFGLHAPSRLDKVPNEEFRHRLHSKHNVRGHRLRDGGINNLDTC